ncbi:MAG: carboxypeptidase regulatory-like domain-containing protein [Methanophagales archaeon]|nr:carboxypeptidase regulatory-like domain-containing protein [Methanophagales archaeon]
MIFLILTAVISSDGFAFMPSTALACPSGSCTSTASINDTTFNSPIYSEGIKDTDREIGMGPSSGDKTIFYDDFHDGNYDGWTVVRGSWSAANCYLESTCGHCGASIQTPLNISTEKAVFQFYAAFPLLDCRGAGFTLKDSHGDTILSFGPDYCVPWGSPSEVRFWIRDGGYWRWTWPADTGWHFYTLVFERGEYRLFYDGISIINATGPARIDAATLELGGWQHRNPGTGYDNVMVEWEALVEVPASKYAPNLWFGSTEELYPTSPFFDDEDLSGEDNKNDYYALSLDEKMDNFTIYYHTVDAGDEIVYEYWFYYAFNDFVNKHYHDWETVYVFVDKSTEEVTRVVASAHTKEFPNNVLENPQFAEGEHAGILVEEGSHASCTDRNNNGLFERDTDVTNGYGTVITPYPPYIAQCPFAWGIGWLPPYIWDEEDQLNGFRITYDSSYYNLKEITGDFISKFGGLDMFPNSPAWLSVEIEVPVIGGTYLVELFGYPPEHPWVDKDGRYYHPYKIIPKLSDFVTGTVSGSDTTGAIVVILSEEPYYTFADENGNFMLNNIPYGVYNVVVNLEGYTPYKQRFMHEGNTSLGVNGTLYIIPESEAFRIEGIATDAEGNIIPNATINVYDESGTQLFTTLTDENGTYLVMVSERQVYTVEALTETEVGLAKVSGKAGSVVRADITVGKVSIVEYIDRELQDLIEEVNGVDITKGIKNSLLSKLESARSKNEDALKFIGNGKEKQANNMLNAEDNIMNAFINEVEAQSGKKLAEEDTEHVIAEAMSIRALIRLAIKTPI